jgi:hypothetical protein
MTTTVAELVEAPLKNHKTNGCRIYFIKLQSNSKVEMFKFMVGG